jgi:hypothetical protein
MRDRSSDRGLSIKWYKRWHADELDRLRELGPELKAVLDGLTDIYCMRAGSLPNDDKFIAGNLGLNLQKWRPLKQALIARGLISILGDALECPIALEAYSEAALRIYQASNAGKTSAANRMVARSSHAIERPAKNHNAKQDGLVLNNSNDLISTAVGTMSQPEREENRKEEGRTGAAASVTEALANSRHPLVQSVLDQAKRR